MKNFKFSFAAVIALFAVGITLVSHAKVLKKKRVAPTLFADCFSTLRYVNPPTSCVQQFLVINQSGCGFAQAQVGKAMYGITADLIDPTNCGVSGLVFCCAKITVGSQQCSLPIVRFPDGSNDYAVISEVYCKTQSTPN